MSLVRVRQASDRARLLGSLLLTRPLEFWDRVASLVEIRRARGLAAPTVYRPRSWDEAMVELETRLGQPLTDVLAEPALAEIERQVRERHARLPADAPFPRIYNADFTMARSCYVLCRALRPTCVVETGVAYGMSSAFILQALAVNGHGELHSIDLPLLRRNTQPHVGILAPEPIRDRWTLHIGGSQRVLRHLLPRLQQVDIFIHDSLHTYPNMRREFELVTPYLARPAILLADDVSGNLAFHEWTQRVQPTFSTAIQQVDKRSLSGLAAFL